MDEPASTKVTTIEQARAFAEKHGGRVTIKAARATRPGVGSGTFRATVGTTEDLEKVWEIILPWLAGGGTATVRETIPSDFEQDEDAGEIDDI